jgi:hypothetical protein
MDIVYLLTGFVLAVIMLNGVWMLVNARPPIVRLGRHPLHLPKTAAAGRWVGAAQIAGSAGLGTEFSLLVANSASTAGGYIGTSGVGAMFVCLGAAWWLDYRAGRPISN